MRNRLARQCVCVIALSFILDVANSAYVLALCERAFLTAVLLSIALPLIGLAEVHWFVEARGFLPRVALTASVALGYGLGTATVLWWM